MVHRGLCYKEMVKDCKMVLTPKVTVVPDTKYHGMRWHRGMYGSISCNIGEISHTSSSQLGIQMTVEQSMSMLKVETSQRALSLLSSWKVSPSLEEKAIRPQSDIPPELRDLIETACFLSVGLQWPPGSHRDNVQTNVC